MIAEVFSLVPTEAAHKAAAEAFDLWISRFRAVLPESADIQHVGATSIPGALTKGDLDISVRVSEPEFAQVRDTLDATHQKNLKSVRDDNFAAYEAEGFACPVGVQLVVRGSKLDVFDAFREALLADHSLLATYNALKQDHHGKPMATYRAAKAQFIAEIMSR